MSEEGRVVVVTGSTRGIGRGLVEAFLARGCRVVVTGRGEKATRDAEGELGARHGAERVLGVACDVSDAKQVRALWDAAALRFGRVDLWINNAGTSHPQKAFSELDDADIAAVVETNLLGAMLGVRVAVEKMKTQREGGAVYTMEGFGSDGASRLGMSVYGASKRAVRYFTQAVIDETRGGSVRVGRLSPGIVVTDLLIDVYAKGDPEVWKRSRWFFNWVADPVEEVCPWLADRVLEDRAHGSFLAWMTVLKAVLRVVQPYYWKRDLFAGKLPPG